MVAKSNLKVGELVYYSHTPLALFAHVHNTFDLWKIGLLLEHISEHIYIILSDHGVEECPVGLVRPIVLEEEQVSLELAS